MREDYAFKVRPGRVALAVVREMDNGVYLVEKISVPEDCRGRGVGSRLLDMVIADADAEKVQLCVQPVAMGGLDDGQLVAWYERRGFVDLDDERGWVRLPGELAVRSGRLPEFNCLDAGRSRHCLHFEEGDGDCCLCGKKLPDQETLDAVEGTTLEDLPS